MSIPATAAAVGARLRAKLDSILRDWEEAVRAAVPAARWQGRAVLRDNLPHFLEALAASLETGEAPGPERVREVISVHHGRERASLPEYSLDQILLEYCLLRQTLIHALEEDGPLPVAARDVMLDSIEAAMRESGSEFARTSEDALRLADDRKNQFLARLAHELRTPLGALSNALQILEEIGSPDERAVRQRAIAQRQVQRLTRFAHDLVDATRIVRGQVELRRKTLDLATPLRHALEICRPLIEDRQQRMNVDLPRLPLCVEGDSDRLEQVFINLLTNSARYTPEGGDIWVTAREEDGMTLVAVGDSGQGIAPEVLPRIFDMFLQEDPTAWSSREGLGMGLAIVRQLVNLHGGCVEAHSEGPGCGAEFLVRLPVVRGED